MTAVCPECEGAVAVEADAQPGELLVCPDCGVELELTGLAPVAVALAPREEEDWGE